MKALLASIPNAVTNDHLVGLTENTITEYFDRVFMGLVDVGPEEDNFIWIDGTPIIFDNFETGYISDQGMVLDGIIQKVSK